MLVALIGYATVTPGVPMVSVVTNPSCSDPVASASATSDAGAEPVLPLTTAVSAHPANTTSDLPESEA